MWRLNNPDKAKESIKKWIENNRDRKRQADKENHAANREERNKKRKEWALRNPEKNKASYLRWHKENKHRDRNNRLLREYGITLEMFNDIFASQNHSCAICLSTHSGNGRGFHIDHDHLTGNVRGILCHHCNTMIGLAKDNKEILSNAINYLSNTNSEINPTP